jgi:hypothetical protein
MMVHHGEHLDSDELPRSSRLAAGIVGVISGFGV